MARGGLIFWLELEGGCEDEAHGFGIQVGEGEDADSIRFAVVTVGGASDDVGIVVDDHLVIHDILYQEAKREFFALPAWRAFEAEAVPEGGSENHRAARINTRGLVDGGVVDCGAWVAGIDDGVAAAGADEVTSRVLSAEAEPKTFEPTGLHGII